ncbi:MAG: DUF4105 domain-containing protein [Gallionella sp.]|nr:DUF4105 domain-containing protein [Gallionella sp.]
MHFVRRFKKGGLIAAFFLLLPISGAVFGAPDSAEVAERLKLAAQSAKMYQAPVWSGLLHAENGHANITDKDFLLSSPDFSVEREMQATIDFLYQGASKNVCRFPARYYWLKQQLNAPALALDSCPDIAEFRKKAPLDEISLVFASEMISQPSSMLGHAFLKFSGKNDQGQVVSHAISFYTDANTYNIPKLLFDSLVVGKQGYFSLSPYAEKQQRYVDEEQRNVWEYQLNLDAFHRELIRLHILELKQAKLTYYFHSYNCATLINFILSLSGKPIANDVWVTPKELIRNADAAGLIADTRVTTPSRWLFAALSNQVSTEERRAIVQQVKQGAFADNSAQAGTEYAFIRLELARAYNQYAYLAGELDKARWQDNERTYTQIKAARYPEMSLESTSRYNPRYTPKESQVSLATQYDSSGASLVLGMLPVSHTLKDDNRSYASESNLQLFDVAIKTSLRSGKTQLDHLTIFDMTSLVPYDEITGGLSSRFHIAIEQQLTNSLTSTQAMVLGGAVGRSKRIYDDIDLYVLAGGGAGSTGRNGFLYTNIEAGLILREVWDMKSLLSLSRNNSQIETGAHYNSLNFTQSKFIDSTHTIQLDWRRDMSTSSQKNMVAIRFKKLF